MAKQEHDFKWVVSTSDAEWESRNPPDELPDDTAERRQAQKAPRSSRLWTTALAALLVIGIGGWMVWREARGPSGRGLAQIEAEIASAVEADGRREGTAGHSETRKNGEPAEIVLDESLTSGRYQPPGEQGWLLHAGAIEVGEVSLRSGLAMIEVTLIDTAGDSYRETRFFRQVPGEDWQRIGPDASFWGQEQSLETTYFRFRYQVKDAEAVEAAAAQADMIYAQVSADVGLPPAPERLEVHVLPVPLDRLSNLRFEDNRLAVPSPKLLRIPAAMSESKALLKSIVHPLVTHTMNDAVRQGAPRPEWTSMLSGLQIWQIYVGSGSLGPGVQQAWMHDDTETIRGGKRESSIGELQLLCREYSTWHFALPSDLSLSEVCLYERREFPSRLDITRTPEWLAGLLYYQDEDGYPYESWYADRMRSVAATTMVDYAVQTYGRECLPALLEGFRTQSHWETLIPQVFGVSAAEFEAGWREFRQ